MWEDPIVAEVHRTREKLAAEYNFDLAAFFAGLRKRQTSLGARLVHQKESPNQSLQPTGAAIPVSQGPKSLEATPAAELWRYLRNMAKPKRTLLLVILALPVIAFVIGIVTRDRESATPLPMAKPLDHTPISLPARVAELREKINEARDPEDAYHKTIEFLGKEHRITGSIAVGLEWDVEGGTIGCGHNSSPVFCDHAKNVLPLRRTQNKIDDNLYGNHE
jgi:hypothetical protein